MSSFSTLYPARNRQQNIDLINGLRFVRNQQEFELADKKITAELHPSLFAELDWMEMTMPYQQRRDGARLVDEIFIYHLREIISQRHIEFDLSPKELEFEISSNIDFYQNLLVDEQRPVEVLSNELSQKIRDCVKTVQPDIDEIMSTMCQSESPRILRTFMGVKDQNWLLLMIQVEFKNVLAQSLDHVASRMKTKQFLRKIGGQFPQLQIPSIESDKDL